jgi:DNA-binding PadR family transcriptional regulator
MDELTDLEGAALALIARHGVTTSYVIAKTFADSPSEFWSGSAGAVYPLIKRLLEKNFIAASAAAAGKRARTDYRMTDAGRVAFRAWLLDATRAAGIGFDPLRTRAIHLDQVSAAERAQFLAEVRQHLDAAAKRDVWPDEPRLKAIHASVTAARKAWLKALMPVLK